MHRRKADGADEPKRAFKILLRLPREARDQVGSQGAAGEVFPQQRGGFREARGIVFAVHRLQRPVTAALQRQVEVAADVPARGQARGKLLGDDRRLQ